MFLYMSLQLKLPAIHKVLVLLPINTLHNWAAEFKKWLRHAGPSVYTMDDTCKGKIFSKRSRIWFEAISDRISALKTWHRLGGVMLMVCRCIAFCIDECSVRAMASIKPFCPTRPLPSRLSTFGLLEK